ncbi:hypothetical protein [Pseudomonas sp. zjy_14]|uniref:hypothetical protein n=1 Tax=Pseudomonas sp. zjy_14 TaxID=3367264 RepID=UPI00370BB80C
MPTENRSSNTEMVSTPFQREDRYIVIKRSDLDKLHPSYKGNFLLELNCISAQMPSRECLVIESDWPEYKPAWAAIEARVTGKPAPQPHPEPIAWMVGTAFWWTKEEAERDAAATGLPIVGLGPMPTRQDEPAWFMTEGGVSAMHAKAKAMSDQQGLDTSSYCVPLYTHADAGEVERLQGLLEAYMNAEAEKGIELVKLRTERKRMDEALVACSNERDELRKANTELEDQVSSDFKVIDDLRAQQAERGALLREALEFIDDGVGRSDAEWRLIKKLRAALSPDGAASATDEPYQGIPGTSFQRLNALANQGE